MKRRMLLIGLFVAIGYFMVHSSGCGNRQGELDPTTPIQPTLASTSVVDGHVRLDEVLIRIFIPQLMEEKEIYDPWLYNAIISILPEDTRLSIFAEGWAFIEDTETAGMIVAVAGMESYEMLGGVLLAVGIDSSWSCALCGYAVPPCCTPWPACCSKDKDMHFPQIMEY